MVAKPFTAKKARFSPNPWSGKTNRFIALSNRQLSQSRQREITDSWNRPEAKNVTNAANALGKKAPRLIDRVEGAVRLLSDSTG